MRGFCLVVVMFVVSLGCFSSARADKNDGGLQRFWERLATAESKMSEARSILESKPMEEWKDVDVEQYLQWAVFVAYYGNLLHVVEDNAQAQDGTEFRSANKARSWPGNPYRNWEDMVVLSPTDEFSAGDLVFEACPSSEESIAGTEGRLVRCSFELSVYGADVDHGRFGYAAPHPKNKSWATKPLGALYSLGYWREPAYKTYADIAERQELKRKAREEAEKAKLEGAKE